MTKAAFLQSYYRCLLGILLFALTSAGAMAQTTSITLFIVPQSISESAGPATAILQRSGDTTNALTINLSSNNEDRVTVPDSVVIEAGESTGSFDVINIVDNNIVDSTVTVTILAEVDGSDPRIFSSATIDVTNDDNAVLTLSADVTSFPEDTGMSNVTVTRNTSTANPLSVSLSGDTDEATFPVVVTIPAGEDSAVFTVTGVDDMLVDGNQTISITANASGFSSTGITLTVLDDDVQTLTITMAETRFSENNLVKVATLRRNTLTTSPLDVELESTEETAAIVPAQITIPAGEDSIAFTVTSVDDDLIDGSQFTTIRATASGFIAAEIELEILDDESPQLQLTLDRTTISENGDSTLATVTRNTDLTLPLTVNLTSSDPDEIIIPASIEIPAGLSSTSFTITGNDDDELDGTVAVTLTATGVGSPSVEAMAILNVSDDDIAGMTISETGGGTIVSESGLADDTFTVVLNAQPLSDVVLLISSDDTTEADVDVDTLTFTNTDWDMPQTVTVSGIDDDIIDGNQVSSIIISVDAANSDDAFDAALAQTVLVVTTDDEIDAITVNPISGLLTSEGGASAAFDVVLNSAPGDDVTITLSSNDASEGIVSSITPLTFTAGDWFIAQTVTVDGVDDPLVDGNINYNIVVNPATSSDLDYDGFDPADVALINIDDDAVGFSVIETGGDTVVAEAGTTDTVQVVLNNAPMSSVVINISNADPTELALSQTSLTFTTTNWNMPQIITLAAVDDADLDGNQNVVVTFAVDGANSDDAFDDLADQTINVTTIDNDGTNTLTLTIPQSSILENAGSTLATVSRNTGVVGNLTVDLESSDDQALTVPAQVTIPDGSDSIEFIVTILDDNVVDGNQTVTITATDALEIFDSASDTIDILDDDLATLTLDVVPTSIGENGATAQLTISRDGPTTAPLTVVLDSSDTSEATLPASAQIAAGDTSVMVTVTGVDDLIVDGPQSVTLSASANGFNTALTEITVTDNDDALLTLDIVPTTISEQGGIAIATVTRNSDLNNPLTVTLDSSDPSEATVPAAVVIQAGQSAANFAVVAVDDAVIDGNQMTTISAAAMGFDPVEEIVTVTDAGATGTIQLTLDNDSISENGGSAIATITRNGSTDSALTLALNSDDSSEATVPPSVTIPVGQTSTTFTVSAVDDAIVDGSQTVNISASGLDRPTVLTSITVTDDDVATLSLSINPDLISENGGLALATLSRNTDTANPLQVNLSSSDTTEAVVPDVAIIAAGQSSVTVTVTAVDDALMDGPQLVTIDATAPLFDPAAATIEIDDDETPRLTLTLARDAISENGDSVIATVSRNTPPDSLLSVTLSSGGSTEVTLPATIDIPANQTSASFTVTGVDDDVLDGTQTVTLTASADDFSDGVADLDVLDDDVAEALLSFTTGAGVIVSETGTTDTFEVVLSAQPTTSVFLTVTSSDTGEAVVDLAELEFDNTTWNIPQSVEVTGVDDAIADGNQITPIIVSVDAVQSDDAFDNALDRTVQAITTDDETPSITVAPTSGLTTTESGASAQFDVVLSTPPSDPVTIALDSDNANEGMVDTLSLSFDSSDWFTPKTVTVTGVDDPFVDGSIAYNIVLDSAVSDDDNYNMFDPVDVAAVNIDDDSPGFSVLESDGFTLVGENGVTDTVSVVLNQAPTSAVVIQIDNSNANEVLLNQTVLIFTPNDWNIPRSIIVSAFDDADLDGNQIVTLMFSIDADNSDAAFADLSAQNIDVTVVDNDTDTLTLTIPRTSIPESGVNTSAVVSRSITTVGDLTVNLSSNDLSELLVPATVTILDDSDSVEFNLTILDDTLIDGTQTVTVTASAVDFDDASDMIDVLDDDQPILTLTPTDVSISEPDGSAQMTLTRSNAMGSAVTVLLSSSDSSEATVPASVTIPAGQASTTFEVSAVDDFLVDGPQTVTLTANAADFTTALVNITVNDDDVEALTLEINLTSITELGFAIATVTRNTNLASALEVMLMSSDETEAIVPDSVTILAGQTSVDFAVTAIDDRIVDGDQLVTISAVAGLLTDSVDMTIRDVGATGTLTLEIDTDIIAENGGVANATVTRDSEFNDDLVVELTSNDPSEAIAPETVTIPAGETTAMFMITAVDDDLDDGDQTVAITAAALDHQSAAVSLTVTDDDLAQLSLTINPDQISENGGVALAMVTRNTATDETLEVTLSSSDTGEAVVPNTVIIEVGDDSAIFAISGVDDGVSDGNQLVTIDATAIDFIPANALITIGDDETPQLTLSLERDAISENGDQTAATVTRNTATTEPLTVMLSSNDEGEATVPLSVDILAGQSEATFFVSGVDDTIIDGTQTVTITATADDFAAAMIDLDVLDDETAGTLLTQTGGSTLVSESGTTDTFDVVLTAEPASDVVVDILSTDLGEATVDFTSLTFMPTDWDMPQTVTVTGVDDALIDGDQQTAVIVSVNADLSDDAFDNAPDQTIQVITTDDDEAGITVTPISGLTTSEAGATAMFDVVLNREPSSSVIITLDSDDPTEGMVSTTQLTFLTTDWDVPQTVTVTGLDDALIDGDVDYNIVLDPAQSGDSNYDTLDPVDVAVTNTDDDISGFSVTESAGSTQASEDGMTDNISVVLASAPTSSVVFTVTSADPGELFVDRDMLTFTPSNWDIPQLVTVTAFDDALADGNQIVDVTISVDAANSDDAFDNLSAETVMVTTIDNETATLTLNISRDTVSENGGSTLATVSRNSATTEALEVMLMSDDTSEITVDASVTIAAGADSAEFVLTIIDDIEVDGVQTVTITATATDHDAGSDSIAVLDDDLPSLTLSLDSASISENGGSAQGTVTRSSVAPTELTVNLTSSDLSEAVVPATVIIPANQASAPFTVQAINDNLVDGTQTVTLTANAAGVTPGLIGIDITDDDEPTLTLAINPVVIEELGNSAAIAVITRNTAIDTTLLVTLDNSDATEISIPASVTIPLGESSATFPVNAIDDAEVDGDQIVTVTASADGFDDPVSATVQVLDSGQTGRLILEIDPDTIPEDGSVISNGTVTRNGDTSSELIVVLSSNDTSEVTVPASVTIAAGQNLASFELTAVDDNITDGTQTVIISATAEDRPTAVTSINVTDDDALRLTLTVDPQRVRENGGVALATVTRNTTDLANPLTVTLSVNIADQIVISPTVTIEADQATATFLITGLDDDASEEDIVITITGSAPNFMDGSVDITVLDDEPIFSNQFE